MKTRHLDHIDLRVKDLAVAFKFYRKLLPELGFTCDRSDSDWGTFYATGRDKAFGIFRLHGGSRSPTERHANRFLGAHA
jgi:catechol 2,3-dioxygenase-like lactoylglutathione lyase family enzyme